MALSQFTILALALLQFEPLAGFPTGAPVSACQSMSPKHTGISAQTGASPYGIQIKDNTFRAGQKLEVIITGADYKGILLQARKVTGSTAVGTWETPSANTKAITCFNIMNSSVTHSNTNLKMNETTYIWTAPSSQNCVRNISFLATVAESKAIYWLDVKSPQLSDETCSSCVKIKPGFTLLLFTLMWRIVS